ncbi:hypothetical protein BDB00DRAFT_807710 [Zychaea mexicana]|uniref:uncharacterized protein n=1 Tax=Zychaea mexicana TaxID=64656 RepID=UPI0022FEFA87|nr:uncharacterized protein BDB00DRAFT_807710 [Zychaea mexicana]KAI9496894.1 hypothetical protein BDB00DRAFT_807710 [Zychaea mexicana]
MANTVPNYISIYDNKATANFIYLSESVSEVLGWTPEEMIGKGAYEFFHPADVNALTKIHSANVMNEKMSSMTAYRTRHKDGHYVVIETLVHYCYDVLMCTNYLYDPTDAGHKIRSNSVDEVFVVNEDGSLELVGAWNDSQERMQRSLETRHRWVNNRVAHVQEPRFCLILNRYTEDSTIVFVSQMVEQLVGAQCDQVLGRSLLDFVNERDAQVVLQQLDMVKGSDMIMRIRFEWITDREHGATQPVEAIVGSSNDGLVVVIRLAPRMTLP